MNKIDDMIADLVKEKIKCIKIKAENTIENFMFHSLPEIIKYLKLDKNIVLDNIKGETGKSKMERLFNKAAKNYKTAGVVHGLISNLDMKKIIDKEPKLKEIEKIIKKQHGFK